MIRTVTRNTLTKDVAREWLSDVPAGLVFLCHDGRTLRNLQDLASSLRIMSPETFRRHVTAERNEFSRWIVDVIGDIELASQVQEAKDMAMTSRIIEERLIQLRFAAWLWDRG